MALKEHKGKEAASLRLKPNTVRRWNYMPRPTTFPLSIYAGGAKSLSADFPAMSILTTGI